MKLLFRKYRNKLFLSFSLLSLLSFVVFFMIFYIRSEKIIKAQSEKTVLSALDQAASYTNFRIDYMIRLSELIGLDRNTRNILTNNPLERNLSGQLTDYKYLSEYISSLESPDGAYRIRFYMDDAWFIAREQYNFYKLSQYDYRLDKEFGSSDVIYFVPAHPVSYTTANTQSVITVVRKIMDHRNFEEVAAIICIDILESTFAEILEELLKPYEGNASIVDQAGRMITGHGNMLDTLQAEDYFSEQIRIKQTNWIFDIKIAYRSMLVTLRLFQRFLIWAALALVSFIILFSFLLSLILSQRLSALANSMHRMLSRELPQSSYAARIDEIAELESDFGYMADRIGKLVESIKDNNLNLRNAELRILFSQINPHFLYNTLDLISWMAIEHNAENIRELVQNLSQFYKISLKKGLDIVTLADEIRHIQFFIKIENSRFDDAILLDLAVPSEHLLCRIPKITLQPLVENCILHGIMEKKEKKGRIRITSFKSSEDLILEIQDDGVGISAVPDLTFNSGRTDQGYAVKNIQERLVLLYGEAYGLSYARNEWGGTTVAIRLPYSLV